MPELNIEDEFTYGGKKYEIFANVLIERDEESGTGRTFWVAELLDWELFDNEGNPVDDMPKGLKEWLETKYLDDWKDPNKEV